MIKKNSANRQSSFTDSIDDISPEFDNTVIHLKNNRTCTCICQTYTL